MEVMTELRSAYQEHTVEVEEVSAAVAELDAQYAAGTITQEEYEAQIESLTENSSDFMTACVKLAGAQGLSGLLAIMTAADEDF